MKFCPEHPYRNVTKSLTNLITLPETKESPFEKLPDELEEADELLEVTELALDLSEDVRDVSFFVFGFGFAVLAVVAAAAVFMAVSLGGGGVAVLSSLSLLLSGLNMLLVFGAIFFWGSALAGTFLLVSLVTPLWTCLAAGKGFLFIGLGAGLVGLVMGVTVADAFGFVGGFLFDFPSSDSDE
jgi:hypothetical protein